MSTQAVIDRLDLSVGASTELDRGTVQSDVSSVTPVQPLGLDSSVPAQDGWGQELILRSGSLMISGSGQEPAWARPAFSKMQELVDLEPGWDGYDAVPIRAGSIMKAALVLVETMTSDTNEPWIVPTVHGGIQMEWHKSQVDLEIEIKPDETASVFFVNDREGREVDELLDTDKARLFLDEFKQ